MGGAGRGCNDLICLFIGTGIGGGIVSGGNLLSGCTNTAGELGHITVDMHGARSQCGRRGWMEAFGGAAKLPLARDRLELDPESGLALLNQTDGNVDAISAKNGGGCSPRWRSVCGGSVGNGHTRP
ncbi:MAG: ROK family protein [bacterium]|nr:ROK family protein [bacterium]